MTLMSPSLPECQDRRTHARRQGVSVMINRSAQSASLRLHHDHVNLVFFLYP
jgi:hypothetical protein